MPLVLADRVRETTTTTGQGTITLAGAVTGFQSFSVIGNGNTTYYTIAGQGTSEWEVGIGTYTSSGTTLSRDVVLASSAGAPTKTTFSAGTKDVFVTYPAGKSVYEDASDDVSLPGNFTLTGTTKKFQADFSNGTVNNRLLFQTSTANSATGIYAVPNGSSTAASWQATNNADTTNASKVLIATNGSTDVQLVSGINGTGTYLPLTIFNGGVGRFVFGTSGQFGIGPTATVNYGTSGQVFTSGGPSAAPSWTSVVTSVTGTSPVASSGGTTPAISLSSGYGDTQNPYASKTANSFLAAPNGSAGVPTFRAIVAADVPTLNQNTTGSAATLTTARTIQTNLASTSSASFDGSANITPGITGTLGVANGGTGQTTYTDGQLLIGNTTGNTLTKATLTQGSGITITNGAGSITIAATGGSGTVTSVSAGAGMSFTTITSTGSVAMGTPSTITNTSTNTASGTSHNHALTGELVETTTGSPLYYGARAWVNFNGTGTVAIRTSVNVTSITDNGGVGNYTVNISTAMADSDYVILGFCRTAVSGATLYTVGSFNTDTKTTSATQVRTGATGTLVDAPEVDVVIFR